MKAYVYISILIFYSALLFGNDDGVTNDKLYFGPCNKFAKDLTFDCYRSFDEVVQFLQDAAKQYPGLAKLESIGKSFEGRDLWVITITDYKTGAPDDKPGIWVDGGVDSDEVIATEVALGLIHRLLTSNDSDIVHLRKTRVFYILPNMIPDVSELHHKTPMRPRDSTMRPWDDDGDGKFDEDAPDDLNGDNQALQMRVQNSAGQWVKDEKDDRLLRPRKPDDEGPFYKRYSEGKDDDGDGKYNEDGPGGIDPNRNYPGNWSLKQRGSGPFPGSELELRTILDFIYSHPNIAASQHLHSSGGVILRPPSVPEMVLPNSDLQLYIALSERGLDITEYGLATSVYKWNFPRGSKNKGKGQLWRDSKGNIKGLDPFYGGGNYYGSFTDPEDAYAAYGGSLDGMYELFGILAFANEIYRFGEDLDNDGR
ncbi:MAG: M14 family metallopeptidase, partial [Candidatus Marinimicrobia bacterium]|nr:M14 family metallopeptidase [Candidatus Neomarinimicrobiota bacterium]